MTAMSRNKGAAANVSCSASCHTSWSRGAAKLGAARDGGCDGMDVPGWAVEVKRTEVLTLRCSGRKLSGRLSSRRRPVLFWRKSRAKWVAFMDPHDLAPEIFQPGGDPLSMPLPRWCEMARAGLGELSDMESAA